VVITTTSLPDHSASPHSRRPFPGDRVRDRVNDAPALERPVTILFLWFSGERGRNRTFNLVIKSRSKLVARVCPEVPNLANFQRVARMVLFGIAHTYPPFLDGVGTKMGTGFAA